jgi:predicted adenylyl cyclase CyaB
MEHINIEIKAKAKNTNYIRKFLLNHNADFKGTDHQIDTYFNVSQGRLKLRQGDIENNLIYYDRENKKGPKQSNVILYNSNPKSSLKNILERSLGILTIVNKVREIYFIDNVKFHIDKVKSLGEFVEIEAIDLTGDTGKEKLLKQCNEYLNLFKINPSDLISNSYSDLLLNS